MSSGISVNNFAVSSGSESHFKVSGLHKQIQARKIMWTVFFSMSNWNDYVNNIQ